MKTAVMPTIALLLLAAVPARAQMSTTGEYPNRHQGASQDPTDPAVRYQKSSMGMALEDWARHLDDPDHERRLEAVRLLAGSGDPKATQYLTRAVDNPDPRVATLAVDSLGKLAAKEASDVLCGKLFMANTSPALRQHILAALGRIRDPASARRILTFAQGESNPDLRATAIRVLGEIGDDSVRDDVHKLSETETDPKLKTLLEEAEANLAAHRSGSVGTDSVTTFSHSETQR
jgi:HEAT repeat protein